jgi:hypothetical protein
MFVQAKSIARRPPEHTAERASGRGRSRRWLDSGERGARWASASAMGASVPEAPTASRAVVAAARWSCRRRAGSGARCRPAQASMRPSARSSKLRAERQGRPAPSTPGPLTVGELAALYFESRLHLKPSTRRADAQVFLYHVAPTFGDSPLRHVRADEVRLWETTLRDEGVSHRSVSKAVWLLCRLLAWATGAHRSRGQSSRWKLPRSGRRPMDSHATRVHMPAQMKCSPPQWSSPTS